MPNYYLVIQKYTSPPAYHIFKTERLSWGVVLGNDTVQGFIPRVVPYFNGMYMIQYLSNSILTTFTDWLACSLSQALTCTQLPYVSLIIYLIIFIDSHTVSPPHISSNEDQLPFNKKNAKNAILLDINDILLSPSISCSQYVTYWLLQYE